MFKSLVEELLMDAISDAVMLAQGNDEYSKEAQRVRVLTDLLVGINDNIGSIPVRGKAYYREEQRKFKDSRINEYALSSK